MLLLSLQFGQVSCNQSNSLILLNFLGLHQNTLGLILSGIKAIPYGCTVKHRFTYAKSIFGAVVHEPVSPCVSNERIAFPIIGNSNLHVMGWIVIIYIVYCKLLALVMIYIIGSCNYIITCSCVGGSCQIDFTGLTIGEHGTGDK